MECRPIFLKGTHLKNQLIGVLLSGATLLSACAEDPKNVSASYVSPSAYQGKSCSQLTQERARIVSEVNTLTAAQKKAATNDAVATGVALVLFWPAIFALALTDDEAVALSAAKGNYEAIETQMRSKRCKMPEPLAAATVVADEPEKKRSWE